MSHEPSWQIKGERQQVAQHMQCFENSVFQGGVCTSPPRVCSLGETGPGSLFSAIVNIGALLGALCGGPLSQRVGRDSAAVTPPLGKHGSSRTPLRALSAWKGSLRTPCLLVGGARELGLHRFRKPRGESESLFSIVHS